MKFDKLFTYLSDKGFQDARTGNLMFPIYIYTYPPEREYEARKEIGKLDEKLSRPKNNLQCQVINLYEFFIEYLKSIQINNMSFFQSILEIEKEDPENTYYFIVDKLHEPDFYNYFRERVKSHFTAPPVERKSYLLVHGFGNLYPYLRVNTFSKNIEHIVKDFKVIIFYPGSYESGNYKMFNAVESENAYRATYLNQIID